MHCKDFLPDQASKISLRILCISASLMDNFLGYQEDMEMA